MDDREERLDPILIDALIGELLGTDPVRCGEAHAQLLALGGFSHPDIRDALARAAQGPAIAPAPSRALPQAACFAAFLPRTRTPRSIGSFRLGDCVGRGAFGVVHRAEDLTGETGHTSLCIKTIPQSFGDVPRLPSGADLTSQALGVERQVAQAMGQGPNGLEPIAVDAEVASQLLLAECALLRGLESDLFPEVLASGIWDGEAFYAMELLSGRDLRAHLVAGTAGALDARRLFRRLARELSALHERDGAFFHGDLKPENIVVTPTRLRLIDPALRTPIDGVTMTTTLAYNPFARTGPEADTTAMAITLLELLTGENPFRPLQQPLAAGEAPELDAYLPRASRSPLVPTLMRWVLSPPSFAEFATALSR